MIDAGEALSAARSDALAALEAPFGERAGELGLAGAALVYDPSPITAEVLAARFPTDLERGLTGAGPHHDEVRITAGERELRTHGSQGEQRVAVLALLLAEAELLGERRGVPPLLLLDDVLSELDGERRAALVQRIRAELPGARHDGRSRCAAGRSRPAARGEPRPRVGGVMERLGDSLDQELRRFGATGSMPAIVAAWPEAVGEEVARNAWPARISRDGVLHVNTSSSAWSFELTQLAAVVLEQLAARLDDVAPKGLRFAPGHLPEPPVAPSDTPRPRSVEPSPEQLAEARELASPIEHEELRERVARAAALSLATARSDRRF